MDAPDLMPEEWLRTLHKRLQNDRPAMEEADAYYRGRPPLPEVPRRAADKYRWLLERSRTNVVAPVITALTDRLKVDGFAHADDEVSQFLWATWQRNRLPARQRGAYIDAKVKRRANLLVWTGPAGPRITVEDACQTVVAVDPEDGTTVWAGLKVWADDLREAERANVYLPEGIHKFTRPLRAARSGGNLDDGSGWTELPAEFIPAPAELRGHVPMVPMVNRPDLDFDGVSEVDDCVPIQDRLNKTVFDRMVASEYGAFRQRWATGLEIPTDPETNEPIFDSFEASISHMAVNESPDGKFGTFDSTDLGPYLDVTQQELELLARVKGLPPHLLTAKGEFPSGDALRSAEAPVVLRTQETAEVNGDAWETAQTYAAWLGGMDVAPGSISTVWHNAETRTYGEAADWGTKLASAQVPMSLWLPRLGFNQDEVREALQAQDTVALLTSFGGVTDGG